MSVNDFDMCFGDQLKQAPVCNGDFLFPAKSIEEYIQANPKFLELFEGDLDQATSWINNRIQDYRNHIGEQQVSAMVEVATDTGMNLKILKLWTSELTDFIQSHNFEYMVNSIPKFTVK